MKGDDPDFGGDGSDAGGEIDPPIVVDDAEETEYDEDVNSEVYEESEDYYEEYK